jgi:hypothetical protein
MYSFPCSLSGWLAAATVLCGLTGLPLLLLGYRLDGPTATSTLAGVVLLGLCTCCSLAGWLAETPQRRRAARDARARPLF